MLAIEHFADLIDGILMILDVDHARVHCAHLAAIERLALTREKCRDRNEDIPVHPPKIVVLVIEAEVFLLHHADDLIASAVDCHHLADRIVRGEELSSAFRSEDHHSGSRLNVTVGDEASPRCVNVVHRRVRGHHARHVARRFDLSITNRHRLGGHRRNEIDAFRIAGDGLRIAIRQSFRRERFGVERDFAGRPVPDPDFLNAAADAVVLHRRRFSGDR